MTNWEKIVCGKNLESAKRLRKNPYIEEKNRKVAQMCIRDRGSCNWTAPFLLRKNYIQKYLHIWYNSGNL